MSSLYVLKTIAHLVTAAKRGTPSGSPGQCNTGPIQCCNSVTQANNPVAALLIGLLGIVVGPTVAVGLTCSPLSIIGVGGNSWSVVQLPTSLTLPTHFCRTALRNPFAAQITASTVSLPSVAHQVSAQLFQFSLTNNPIS